MILGAIIPNAGDMPGSIGIAEMGRAAEEAGAQSLWVSDHLLQLTDNAADYPYSPDGRPTWDRTAPYYEALTCCAFLAAATKRCRIGTAILIAPQRNVLELAKTAATLDQLSDGRLVLGLGAGWSRSEMEALGYSHADRGTRFNEMLQVLRSAWTGSPTPFAGSQVVVPDGVVLQPTPRQTPGPPMLIGGITGPAIRRAARYGDGWMAIAWVGTFEPDSLAQGLSRLKEEWEGAGREGAPHLTLKLHSDSGDTARLPTTLRTVEELGFDEVIVEPPWLDGIDAAKEFLLAAGPMVSQSE